jgi:DNA replication protein DnaC
MSPESDIPKPDVCPKCGGSGWEPLDGMVRRCACMNAQRIERLITQARIPKRYEHCNLDSYVTANPSTKSAKQNVQRYVQKYPVVENGLLILGNCGVGKTHLAVSILKQVIFEKGDSGIFYDFRDLLRDIQSSWNTVAQSSELEILRPVLDASILVLDELGANKPTDWVRDTIAYIINWRYNEKKITIFTSNYLDKPARQGEETLTDRIGARLRSRLYEMCSEVEIQGEDFRQQVRKANFTF